MNKKIKLEIITPEKTIYSDLISQITLPTTEGEITVLPNHIPLISSFLAGEIKIVIDEKEQFLAASGGLIQVNFNEIKILTDTAEWAEEIDEKRAEQAKQRAQKMLEDVKNKETVDYTALAAKLEKELSRLRVVRRHKRQNQLNIEK